MHSLSLSLFSVLQAAWTLVKISRESNNAHSLWQREEPLLFNSALNMDIFKDISFRKSVWAAKITKIGHLPEGEWISAETFAGKLGIRSVRKF